MAQRGDIVLYRPPELDAWRELPESPLFAVVLEELPRHPRYPRGAFRIGWGLRVKKWGHWGYEHLAIVPKETCEAVEAVK